MRPTYHAVDTCAAEFAALTPYYYSAFETEDELARDERPSIVVLGSGPNRIGQGIEFDYCCVHAAETARALGYAAVMVNCNPETVSTDHGVSDRLYMEPVTADAVLDICAAEQPVGVIAQLGGQTPAAAGAHALGGRACRSSAPRTSRSTWPRTAAASARSSTSSAWRRRPGPLARGAEEALAAAEEVGYPVLVRPSYVLGGRAMAICDSPDALRAYLERERPEGVLLVDRFLENAIELDVDALSDGRDCWTAAVMEHVEAAGVHSGDSACVLPAQSAGPGLVAELEEQTAALARGLGAVGLLNVQFAVRDGRAYVIEANPRASRTVPFVSKATGVPLVPHAVRLMLGASLGDLGLPVAAPARQVAVKEAVLPFARFPGADPVLGPEMRATGEVMGLGGSFPEAFAKAQRGAGQALPARGRRRSSRRATPTSRARWRWPRSSRGPGSTLVATTGTAAALAAAGLPVRSVRKISEGSPNVGELIAAGGVALVINTPRGGHGARTDGYEIRAAAVRAGIPCITTIEAGGAAAAAIASRRSSPPRPLQDAALPVPSGGAFRPGATTV